MDRDQEYSIQLFFSGLADDTRLRILNLLREGEVCVLDLTRVLHLSQPKISRHLAYLRSSGLVESRRNGKWMHYAIHWSLDDGRNDALGAALEWLGRLPSMRDELERLAAAVRRDVPKTLAGGNGVEHESFGSTVYQEEQRQDSAVPASPYHNELDEFLL